MKHLWLLDNGHGKATPGKRSPDGRFLEYEFTRDIVSRIADGLLVNKVSFKVIVPEVEGDVGLTDRCNRANNSNPAMSKIYLSIHSNAGKGIWSNAQGTETWYHYKSLKGKQIASAFQTELSTIFKDRGIRCHIPCKFTVLEKTNMPAVLTESGFYTNKGEVEKLLDPTFRQKIADAHVRAILAVEAGATAIYPLVSEFDME